MRSRLVLSTVAGAVALAGCSALEVESEFPQEDSRGDRLRPGEVEEGLFDNLTFGLGNTGEEQGGAQLPVNKHLWRATLDTLEFLPLSSTDPYGGVIVSDWGSSAEAPNERFKVTTYITSAVLKPQSLKVVVNKQTRAEDGTWVAAPVSEDTPRKLEDAILTRARQLRTAEARSEG